jgi:5-methylcytosine-specific restriction endonuclease McrA
MPRSPEAIARAQANYLLRHPERRKATLKKYYEANKERELERVRQWERDNRERHLERLRLYKRGNPIHIASVLDWQKRNPQKVRAYKANTRSNRKKGIGKLPSDITVKLYTLQHGRCAYCPTKLTRYHLDHIVPIARGGLNIETNVQLLCQKCNQSKSDRDPIEFVQSRGLLL